MRNFVLRFHSLPSIIRAASMTLSEAKKRRAGSHLSRRVSRDLLSTSDLS